MSTHNVYNEFVIQNEQTNNKKYYIKQQTKNKKQRNVVRQKRGNMCTMIQCRVYTQNSILHLANKTAYLEWIQNVGTYTHVSILQYGFMNIRSRFRWFYKLFLPSIFSSFTPMQRA